VNGRLYRAVRGHWRHGHRAWDIAYPPGATGMTGIATKPILPGQGGRIGAEQGALLRWFWRQLFYHAGIADDKYLSALHCQYQASSSFLMTFWTRCRTPSL